MGGIKISLNQEVVIPHKYDLLQTGDQGYILELGVGVHSQ